MRVVNLEQGGLDWLAWRSKGIGASDATIILGLSPWFSREQLLRRKSEEIREVSKKKPKKGPRKEADNGAMARGRRLEPVARDLYIGMTGIESKPVCVIHPDIPWMRASLDGLSTDGKTVLEVKCVNQYDHQAALEGSVPTKYVPQVQHQLFVTGTTDLHYWSYTDNPRFSPEDQVALVEVKPSPTFQARLLEAETLFWKELQQRIENPTWLDGD
jgi:putative phage-type endonuclease